nr:hypothetical protein [Tanacetum cinerariifolium]
SAWEVVVTSGKYRSKIGRCVLIYLLSHDCRWLLTYGMELAVTKCLNSPEYFLALGTAISKAIEKGMQDGLPVGITHGKEGWVLTDVAAHNPSTKADYVSTFQQIQGVNFPLLAELKANKDASIEAVMNIIRLEENLAERLGLNKSQPHADPLMVHIHHSPDKTVVGSFALSLALDDVFIPLAEPFSAVAVTCTEGNFDTVPATADTTAALSITFASASIVDPISIDEYEVTTSRITASSLFSSKRVRLISKDSLFCTRSISAVLSVGMPISTGMTASISYVSENGVSLLLDLVIVRCARRT